MAKGRPKTRRIAAGAGKQGAITSVGLLPLLSKPAEAVGKTMKLPGKFWGTSGRPRDAAVSFEVVVSDYQLMHESAEGKKDYHKAFKITEMGTDGTGGTSDDFWMVYPMPFLTEYYKNFPDELKTNLPKHPDAEDVSDDADEEGSDPEDSDKKRKQALAYKWMELGHTVRVNGRLKHHFTCKVVLTNGLNAGTTCGRPITVYSNSTGVFYKHVRRKAAKGCDAHQALAELANRDSCRQVRMPDGTYEPVNTFAMSFPRHIRFVWLVAQGMSMRYSRNPAFKEFVTAHDPRAVLPHNVSVHRIAACIDEVQVADLCKARSLAKASMLTDCGLGGFGLQLDMWTDTNTNISYAAVHSTHMEESDTDLKVADHLLDFCVFPFTKHTADNISTWLVRTLLQYDIPCEYICSVTPDGAGPGVKGIKMVPGLANKVNVCMQHQLQRCVLYAIGIAGSATNCRNPDARDLLKVNKRVVQFSHQVHEFSIECEAMQTTASIPEHKHLTTVRSHAIRWGNSYSQVERNNLMRPIIDMVTSKYRREHANDEAILDPEHEPNAYDSNDDMPTRQFEAAGTVLTRREIGFDNTSWACNLELEALLTRPAGIKMMMDKYTHITAAQCMHVFKDLQKSMRANKPLDILLHPVDIGLKARKRKVATIAADSVTPIVTKGRAEMCTQLEARFFTDRPTDCRLVLMLMSKQANAEVWMCDEWMQHARAVYLKLLRALSSKLNAPRRTSPRKVTAQKRKRESLMQGLLSQRSDSDDDDEGGGANDPVMIEKAGWASMSPEQIAPFRDAVGLLDEYAFYFSVRLSYPLHYTIFRHYAADLAVESNAEETFSLAGRLSSDNGKTGSKILSTFTRIKNNKGVCNPCDERVWKAYITKHSKAVDGPSDDESETDSGDE